MAAQADSVGLLLFFYNYAKVEKLYLAMSGVYGMPIPPKLFSFYQ